jgi:hypothetical protein
MADNYTKLQTIITIPVGGKYCQEIQRDNSDIMCRCRFLHPIKGQECCLLFAVKGDLPDLKSEITDHRKILRCDQCLAAEIPEENK